MANPSPYSGRTMKVEMMNGAEAIGRFHEANANTMLVTFFNGTEVQVFRVLRSASCKLYSARCVAVEIELFCYLCAQTRCVTHTVEGQACKFALSLCYVMI
jgi:hypothetical protein